MSDLKIGCEDCFDVGPTLSEIDTASCEKIWDLIFSGKTKGVFRIMPIINILALTEFIDSDPEEYEGLPTIKGSKLLVWQLIEELALGNSIEDIKEYVNFDVDIAKGLLQALARGFGSRR